MPTSASACALPCSSLPFFVWEPCSGLWPGKSASVAGSAASSTSGTASASCAGSLAFPSLTPAFDCRHQYKNFTNSCIHQQTRQCTEEHVATDLYQRAIRHDCWNKISSMHWCQAHASYEHAFCQEHAFQGSNTYAAKQTLLQKMPVSPSSATATCVCNCLPVKVWTEVSSLDDSSVAATSLADPSFDPDECCGDPAASIAGDASWDAVPCIGDASSLFAGLDAEASAFACWALLSLTVTGFKCLSATASQTSYVSDPKRTKCTSSKSPEFS